MIGVKISHVHLSNHYNSSTQAVDSNSGSETTSNQNCPTPKRESYSRVFALKEQERRQRAIDKRKYRVGTPSQKKITMPEIEQEDGNTYRFNANGVGGNPKVKCAICGGVALFVVIFTIVIIVDSVHTINEGMVGIYFINGALMNEISHPGVHWSLPFVTEIEEITIRPRTDTLDNFQTVTKDGIQNNFVGIQVLSDVDVQVLIQLIRKFGMEFRQALIFDRIKEELRTFCANNSIDDVYNEMFLDIVRIVKINVEKSIARLGLSGIQILNLVIPKPEIPSDIAKNYKAVKVQWTEQLVASQAQKTEKIKKETETMKAILDAKRQKEVLQIDIEKDILRKEGEKKLSELENEILKLREQNIADVENYKKTKEAEANQRLFTPDYVRLEMAKSLSNNTKFFFSGDQSPLGAVLAKIMGQK